MPHVETLQRLSIGGAPINDEMPNMLGLSGLVDFPTRRFASVRPTPGLGDITIGDNIGIDSTDYSTRG